MNQDSHPRKYLLYADDDVDDREIMQDMIAEIDPHLEVVMLSSGLTLLEFLHSLPVHATYPFLIILDVNMPRFDGIETLQKLKSDRDLQHIPVVMFSTSNQRQDIDRCMHFGARDFITKPICSDELIRVTSLFSNYCHDLPAQTKTLKDQ